ncbi:MAG: nitrate reductase [Gammaproteobacteria bacterium]|nr:nitrate reductase [Gammaproteobacteria bacterium]MCP5458068.1 nitrate reductase [Gammaproteobacteria bacterium]
MSLLDFARGPGLHWAFIIFVFGICWRFVGTLLIARRIKLSTPRRTDNWLMGLKAIETRSWPVEEFHRVIRFQHYSGYIWHISFFIVLFFFQPHILFFKSILGISWPGLPNDVILVVGAIAVATLVALLGRRLSHPVLRKISNVDDYISWLVTTLPLITGFMAFAHVGGRYETLLALHILSVELLMVWFPFGKLIHAVLVVPSRFQIGASFGRRGVRA